MKFDFKNLILKNRSYRRFDSNIRITKEALLNFIEFARYSPSAGNLQPLKYYLSYKQEINKKIFSCLKWASYLKEWNGPLENEQPSAYIVVLGDDNLSKFCDIDAGIASQSILLGAVSMGYGGCILGSVDINKLQHNLCLPEKLRIILVIALGKPSEVVVLEDIKDNNIKYWRDEKNIHHVPKKLIKDIVLNFNTL